jgi:DNA-binding NarL/FixJ family response regulator
VRPARRAPPHRRPAVCLYWLHPLLLTEFQHQLPSSDFRLTGFQLDSYGIPDLGKLSCPRASLYALESHPRRLVTEAIVSAVARRSPGARVLVIAEEFHEANAFPLLRLGAKGLLKYSEMPSQLTRAVGVVAAGGFWVPRALLSAFLDKLRGSTHARLPPAVSGDLTQREREVLEGLLQNLQNKEIAKKLQISERTAKFHVSNLLAKFGVQRRADLILLTTASAPER